MNETLQLQRLAHEELGLGTWTRCDKDVPVTTRFERLGVLMRRREHIYLRLKVPPAGFEDECNRWLVVELTSSMDRANRRWRLWWRLRSGRTDRFRRPQMGVFVVSEETPSTNRVRVYA